MAKRALSATNQQVQVAKYINNHGSINRYEADAIGICHLAPRINALKRRGINFHWINQIIIDSNDFEHKGIRRYWFDYEKMTKEQIETLTKLLGKS
ncbi:hypothetical protein I6F53_03735 [Pseudoalteromonas sp. SWN29]|uniref:helix-turn-helix domain-containing protein n=1 Tax=Pseudoalteromonas sp. SWN29 TaxID=2792064 RepID=UPI0018CE0B73|nr:helix-turn-helix domain-containing protein [Pseudoalteromonas sp. SWN29]MBH0026088.1 hypothetical protein [Pseudoalteromonas sp. SWN29]